MGRLKNIRPLIPTIDQRAAKEPDKVPDPHYATSDHRLWRDFVLRRAGFRCEGRIDGRRCNRADGKLYADHIQEIRDNGEKLDPDNGQALCASCHTKKTIMARAARLAPST